MRAKRGSEPPRRGIRLAMVDADWLVYGAYGTTGRRIVDAALARGERPLLAGRDAARLRALAEAVGLPWVAVELDDATALKHAVSRVRAVVHAAGPFVVTGDPMRRACLAASAHYLDITGEHSVLASTFQYDSAARERGVALIGAVGFDVVPSEGLAAFVASRISAPVEIEVAIAALGRASVGTARSALGVARDGGGVVRDGKFVDEPVGRRRKSIRFDDGEREVVSIPSGDLEMIPRSTGVRNVSVYFAVPRVAARAVSVFGGTLHRMLRAPVVYEAARRWIDAKAARGSASVGDGESHLWARARNDRGALSEAWLRTVEGYSFTAECAVRAVRRVLDERPTGALTPAQAFGHGFALEVPGTERFVRLERASLIP